MPTRTRASTMAKSSQTLPLLNSSTKMSESDPSQESRTVMTQEMAANQISPVAWALATRVKTMERQRLTRAPLKTSNCKETMSRRNSTPSKNRKGRESPLKRKPKETDEEFEFFSIATKAVRLRAFQADTLT